MKIFKKEKSDKRFLINSISLLIFLFMSITFFLVFFYNYYQPIPFEVEGECNTGFIGIDFQSEFKNEKYKEKTGTDFNFTKYNSELIPKLLRLNNIDGMNCHYKIKGAIPKNIIINNWRLQ